MISLSRIIKSIWAKNDNNIQKKIEIKSFLINSEFEPEVATIEPKFSQEELDLIYKKANEEAQQIVRMAQQEVETVRAQIENERNQWFLTERVQLEEEARQLGYSEGHAMGTQRGYEEMHGQIQQAQHIVTLAKTDYHHYLDSSEKTILELALGVANKILNIEITSNHEVFFQLVRKAIKEAKEYSDIRLRIHYSQYEEILSQKDELMAIFPKETDFHIYPDEELDETSCIIESSSGRIDGSIDSQLQEIKQKLLEILEGE